MQRALVYFAKAPRQGLVKTRLCPPLSPDRAAGLYRAMLEDILAGEAAAHPLPRRAFLYVWPLDGMEEVRDLAPPEVALRPQRGADLAARMAACFQEVFAEGFGAVVLRNTDSPDLPASRVEEAFAALERGAAAVLGPDQGGGYYLLGLARAWPGLANVALEGASAFLRTREAAREAGLAVEVLAEHEDVDLADDLRRFLERGPTPAVARWLAREGRALDLRG